MSEFYWRALAVFIYSYFLQILRCTLTATFQHIIKICTFITKEPNKNKPHEIPHTPDGYRKQNQHRNLMKFFGKHKSVHVLRKEKKQSGSCMLRSHAVPLFISVSKRLYGIMFTMCQFSERNLSSASFLKPRQSIEDAWCFCAHKLTQAIHQSGPPKQNEINI